MFSFISNTNQIHTVCDEAKETNRISPSLANLAYFYTILLVRTVLISTIYITSYIEKTRHTVVFESGSSLFSDQWSVL